MQTRPGIVFHKCLSGREDSINLPNFLRSAGGQTLETGYYRLSPRGVFNRTMKVTPSENTLWCKGCYDKIEFDDGGNLLDYKSRDEWRK